MTKELGPMMRNLRTRGVTLATALTLVFASTSMAHASDGDTATPAEVTAAITQTDARDGTLVADAAPSTTDADSAAQTANVDVPVDPAKGVTLSGPNGRKLTVGLPNAKHGSKGAKAKNGMVVYGGKNGSANASVPTAEGGVQQLVVIGNRKANTIYDYPLSLTGGQIGSVQLQPDGAGAVVFDTQGQPVAAAVAPWARDANGKSVKTYFTAKGTQLQLHVDHKVSGVAYPVVADPFWIPAWAVVQIIRCGFGGWLGYIAAAGLNWWQRALAVVGGCLIGMR